jgi:hypothetical protein
MQPGKDMVRAMARNDRIGTDHSEPPRNEAELSSKKEIGHEIAEGNGMHSSVAEFELEILTSSHFAIAVG